MSVTGESIKNMRIRARLTQKELAMLAGVSQAHVAKIECGKVDPRLSTVNRILSIVRPGQERKCKDIMTPGVIFAGSKDSVLRASEIMVRNAVSQLPVVDGNRVVGTLTEQGIVLNLKSNVAVEKVSRVMGPPLPYVQEDTSIEAVRAILEKSLGVLVRKGAKTTGIITRSDLLRTIG